MIGGVADELNFALHFAAQAFRAGRYCRGVSFADREIEDRGAMVRIAASRDGVDLRGRPVRSAFGQAGRD